MNTETLNAGKEQWDELAAILGCDGDNVDHVMKTAKRLMSERIPPRPPVVGLDAMKRYRFEWARQNDDVSAWLLVEDASGLYVKFAELEVLASAPPAGFVVVPDGWRWEVVPNVLADLAKNLREQSFPQASTASKEMEE